MIKLDQQMKIHFKGSRTKIYLIRFVEASEEVILVQEEIWAAFNQFSKIYLDSVANREVVCAEKISHKRSY